MKRNWKRVSRGAPCPICKRPDWCLISKDGSAVICPRVQSGRRAGEAGYLHRLGDNGEPTREANRVRKADRPTRDLAELARRLQLAATETAIARFAADLGLTGRSLRRLGIGQTKRGAWAFPMMDAAGRVTGIRLRLPDGRKLSIKGGREGLFVPSGVDLSERLFIAEGPTDCAALTDLGLSAIGRPCCTGGTRHVVDYLRHHSVKQVCIVADSDAAGMKGAKALAAAISKHVHELRIITPDGGAKDARAWVRAGATPDDVTSVVEATRPIGRWSDAAIRAVKGGAHV